MPLETANFISDLVSANPTAPDGVNQGDDHLRLIKAVLKATFPNITGAVTKTQAQLNNANAGANVTVLPGPPGGTSNTSGVHMGLGSSWALTPQRTGNVQITISGDVQNTTAGQGFTYHVRHGTGAAPANGQTSLVGAPDSAQAPCVPNSNAVPFSVTAVITGLALGTAVWFDLVLAAFTSGTAQVTNLTCIAVEL